MKTGSLLLLLVIVCSARAESDRQELLDAEPLAECTLQKLVSPTARPEMQPGAVAMRPNMLSVDPLSYYARQIDGQWHIPRSVDRADPWVRLLVLAPNRPLMIDVAVLVDGQPYRAAREQWIDLLIEEAKKESLIGGALAVSTDDALETSAAEANEETPDEQAPDEEAADEDAGAKVQIRQTPGVVKRLVNYLATGGAEEDREEIRWLLAEWAGGPALIALGPAFSWQRAKVAPLWNHLDHDGDRILSAGEIEQAAERLQQADIDEDDVVSLEELARDSKSQSPYPHAMSHPLIVVLNEATAWQELRRTLDELYGMSDNVPSDQTSAITKFLQGTSADLSQLLYLAPDLTCRIDLSAEDGKVSLLAAALETNESVSTSQDVINVDLDSSYLELTGAVGEAKSKLDLRQTQIAVGAIVDGYPLFRLLDRDNNRRLSPRERRQLKQALTACDLNHDDQIDSREIPTAIRLTITHGAHAHKNLSLPTAAVHDMGSEDRTEVPPWFAQMDRNRDGDLSRNEFLGTSQQFQRLDRNGDGLISEKESQDEKSAGE